MSPRRGCTDACMGGSIRFGRPPTRSAADLGVAPPCTATYVPALLYITPCVFFRRHTTRCWRCCMAGMDKEMYIYINFLSCVTCVRDTLRDNWYPVACTFGIVAVGHNSTSNRSRFGQKLCPAIFRLIIGRIAVDVDRITDPQYWWIKIRLFSIENRSESDQKRSPVEPQSETGQTPAGNRLDYGWKWSESRCQPFYTGIWLQFCRHRPLRVHRLIEL